MQNAEQRTQSAERLDVLSSVFIALSSAFTGLVLRAEFKEGSGDKEISSLSLEGRG